MDPSAIEIKTPIFKTTWENMFRPPKLIRCVAMGDMDRYLWVMEPQLGQIYGKAFLVSNSVIAASKNPPADLQVLIQQAYDEMIARSEFELFNMPEGSEWHEFL